MKNILFYKYVNLENLENLKEEQIKLCKSLSLLGTILLAKEGINGCVSGSDGGIRQYKKRLTKDKRFSGIRFKGGNINRHTFKKFHVRIRNEIVSSKFNVDIKNKGKYIEAKELKSLLDSNKDIFLLDARNNYEYEVGRFKGAIHLNIGTFRQFPSKISQLKKMGNIKNKKIIAYCTGGVRCEKASALLRESGFENVYQLHDGILNYGAECGNAHWEGKCFVFDERGAIDIGPNNKSEPVTQCALCHLPNSELHNCAFTKCDEFFTACEKCFEALKGCCSKNCRGKIANS